MASRRTRAVLHLERSQADGRRGHGRGSSFDAARRPSLFSLKLADSLAARNKLHALGRRQALLINTSYRDWNACAVVLDWVNAMRER